MAVSKAIAIQEMTSFIQSEMIYDQISSMIQSKNPTPRGFSPKSIWRFVKLTILVETVNYHVKKLELKFINVFLRYFKPLSFVKMSVVKMLLK